MTEETIYQEMLSRFQEETGYEMGAEADLAVRLRAAAAQIMGLYHYADYTYRQAFPQTAEGEYLDLHGELYGVRRMGAEAAAGFLRFSIPTALEEELEVPAGTVCVGKNQAAYATVSEGVIPAGSTWVEVYATAVEAGSSGNTARGTITKMQSPPDGIGSVENTTDFLGGKDREADETYRARMMKACRGLGNGANKAYYEELISQVGGVEYGAVYPCINGAGTVGVVLASSEGTVAEDVFSAVEETLEKYKEAGVEIVLLRAEDRVIDIAAAVMPGEGIAPEDACTAAAEALTALFHGNTIGRQIYCSELIHCVMDTGKVKNVVLTLPEADIAVARTERAVLGTVTLEEV